MTSPFLRIVSNHQCFIISEFYRLINCCDYSFIAVERTAIDAVAVIAMRSQLGDFVFCPLDRFTIVFAKRVFSIIEIAVNVTAIVDHVIFFVIAHNLKILSVNK